MYLTMLLGLHPLETCLAILCTALLLVAVLRGAPKSTLILLCGCLLMTSSMIARHVLPFELGEYARIVGWLLVAVYCVTLLRVQTPKGESAPPTPSVSLQPKISVATISGLGVGLAANCYVIYSTLTLLSIPRGTAIRPMGLVMVLWQLALGSLLLGVPLSAIGCFQSRGWRRIWGVLGILLSLAVLPIGIVLLQVVAHVAGLIIET
jgi:hypothetical protein